MGTQPAWRGVAWRGLVPIYTRCYDKFKRYFIQAGRSLVFNLPARIYFAKGGREGRAGPGDAISRGAGFLFARLDPRPTRFLLRAASVAA